ncbi:MAG: dTMP kinase [Pseudomonadota bacterium]
MNVQPKKKQQVLGKFITLEGGEGVGKTTQIKMLVERLSKEHGIHIVTSREPGGTPGAEAVRHVLLNKAALETFGPKMEAILLSAARNDHVEQFIRPNIHAGKSVLVDRFMDSTRVYQGATGKIPAQFLGSLERVAIAGMVPELTVILDLDPLVGLTRAARRRSMGEDVDRFEKETLAVHQQRRASFEKIAKAEPQRCVLVDASGTADEVHERIWPRVAQLFGISKQGENNENEAVVA